MYCSAGQTWLGLAQFKPSQIKGGFGKQNKLVLKWKAMQILLFGHNVTWREGKIFM